MRRQRFTLPLCGGKACAFLTPRNAPSSSFTEKAQPTQTPHLQRCQGQALPAGGLWRVYGCQEAAVGQSQEVQAARSDLAVMWQGACQSACGQGQHGVAQGLER